MESIVTVAGASNSFRLTKAETVRAAAELSAGADDAFLNQAIDRQSAAVEKWCRRLLARQAYSETFRDVEVVPALALKHYPIASIASVTVDGTALAADEYEIDAEAGHLYRLSSDCRIDWYGGKIVIAYRAGYILPAQTTIGGEAHGGVPNLPHDLEDAVIELVKMGFYGRARDPLLRSAEIPGVIAESYTVTAASDGAMPARIAAMLAPHRRPIPG